MEDKDASIHPDPVKLYNSMIIFKENRRTWKQISLTIFAYSQQEKKKKRKAAKSLINR